MNRSYTLQGMVPVPVLSGSDMVTLIAALLGAHAAVARASAAPSAEAQPDASATQSGASASQAGASSTPPAPTSSAPLPPNVIRALQRLEQAGDALNQQLKPSSADPKAAVSADAVLDDAWGALREWLTGWSRLPSSRLTQPAEQIAALHRVLFGDGLSFLKLPYRNEWQESQTRLESLVQEDYRSLMVALGGGPFLETVLEAHQAYGVALGITTPGSSANRAVDEALKAARECLRDYVLKVQATIEPDDAASSERATALLRPLLEWTPTGGASSQPSTSTPEVPASAPPA